MEDSEELCRIFNQYGKMLLRLAATRLDSTADAEDCVQDVFISFLSRKISFRDTEHEKAWLIRVTLNRAADIRRKSRHVSLSLDEVKEQAKNDNTSVVLPAIRSLPDKYSAVLHLYYYEDYNTEEIAKILALPKGTVTTRLSRGRNMLKDILKED